MRLKTKLVLAITALVLLISGLLSMVYVSQLLHSSVEQSWETNHIFAEQVSSALKTALELGLKDRKVDPATFARLAEHYSPRAICEIVWLVASEHVYNMTNIGLNIHSDLLCSVGRK